MAIQDLAKNPISAGSAAQMIGYTEPIASAEVLPLDMYRFLLEYIRQADNTREGALFLKRFFEGPQQVWRQVQTNLFSVKNLWSVTECPDDKLKYLKNIVGWTEDLSYITDSLDYDTLRRLIAASAPLWRKRGREETLINILTLVTGARCRIWNWFDYRWIVDETGMGEEHDGRDPWMIENPGLPDYGEYFSTLRIVDEGDLDRNLVKNMVKFMRPVSERIEIAYLNFMDRFLVADDSSLWNLVDGTSFMVVADGHGKLEDDTELQLAMNEGTDVVLWHNYVVYWRIQCTGGCGCAFYMADEDNYYSVILDISANTLTLQKRVSGGDTVIDSYTFPTPIYDDVWYGIRVHVNADGATNRIIVYVDSVEVINATDSALIRGALGWFHDIGETAKLDEIEMFQLPLETELIDINS